MARKSAGNIPLSAMNPKYLHTNCTSHTWAFGAFAELIDNAYDPDVNAKHLWIDSTRIKDKECLIIMDDGTGLDYNKMFKMLSFGYSDKKTIRGHAPVGLYGNGFKSGSMRLGKDVVVFSKTKDMMSVGLLSQTYLAAIRAENIVVPIVTIKQDGEDKISVEPGHEDSLEAILKHSLFKTEKELLQELQAINTMPPTVSTGTRIIIWNLRSSKDGQTEFDFKTDRYDIRIPCMDSGDVNNPSKNTEPESRYSLQAYCSILYLKPRMQIIIRGRKVRTQLVSKSLAHTLKDRYTPKFLRRPIPITFGYGTKDSGHYGIMIYNKNRLIRAYERVGCQRKAIPKGVGIIGIIECNFLNPTHNKQDFDDTEEYRKVKHNLGEKLEEYWNQMHHLKQKKDPSCNLAIEDMEKSPDQNWAQCDICQRWRKLPDGIDASKLPDKWFCYLNPDPQYRTCQAEEELEDSEDEQPYQKTYKQKKKRQNAEDAVPSPSTSTTPSTRSGTSRYHSGTTSGGNVTHFTPPTSTPLNSSGRRPSAQSTPRSSSTWSTPTHPRSKRLLSLTPESEPVKRARVQGHGISSAAGTELLPLVTQATPDAVLLVEESGAPVAPCDLAMMKTKLRASGGGINLQLSDGALAEESMESNTTATAAFAPSAVRQQVSVETQTEGVAKVKEEEEEERTWSLREDVPKSSEQMQLLEREARELMDSSGGMHPLLDMQQDGLLEQWVIASKERDQYKEQMVTANQERDQYRDQVETANKERDQYKEQMVTANQGRDQYRDQVETANKERDQYREQMVTANHKRDQYRDQVETANKERDQYKEQMVTAIQERDQYRDQVETANKERDQYREQMVTANQERDQYRDQVETANKERDQYREQMVTANQERDQYMDQMVTANQERDQYRDQMETANQERDQYRDQMVTANQERDRYRNQMETANQERDRYRDQMVTANQERDRYRDQMETAKQEKDQYMAQVDELMQELQKMRTSSVKQEPCDQAFGGEDDLALQIDSILTDLDCCNKERDQLKSKLESLEAERGAVFSQCEQLKKELDDLREAGSRALSPSCAEKTGNSPSRPGSTGAERLKNLRLSVSRLLVILIPELDLEQVNYESGVIEEILEQYIDGVTYSEAT
ncbi:MORC family CW-type zinc finger protein 3-like [Anguilla anguilla]|uniref:MORC family CW-type zinc finger protein 3-like n=1 Tax=Anguilla anguilla TaxID=7936 RepID=UPI0015B1EE27|nr:MORC family CW-type zinc finger protein 3-like [Anguilla anguilla]